MPPYTSTKAHAFSLIELMVVVAIVAILGAFALPAYQNYTLRTRVAEGISLARSAQVAIATNAAAGLPLYSGYVPPNPTKYVSSISIANYGPITITYTGTPQLEGKTLLLYPKDQQPRPPNSACITDLSPGVIPQGIITWSCRSQGTTGGATQGTVPANLVPPSCVGYHYDFPVC